MGSRKSLTNGQPASPCDREDQGACLTPLRDNGSPRSPCSQASPLPPDHHLYRDKLSPMEPHWLSPELDGSVGAEEDQPSPPLPLLVHSRNIGPSTPPTSSSSSSSPWPGGQLDADTVKAVGESVERLFRTVPHTDPAEVKSLLRLNKKMAKTVGHIFNMEPHDKSKEEEIRKYSLIYGRFDSKRREGKQLTHHEVRSCLGLLTRKGMPLASSLAPCLIIYSVTFVEIFVDCRCGFWHAVIYKLGQKDVTQLKTLLGVYLLWKHFSSSAH